LLLVGLISIALAGRGEEIEEHQTIRKMFAFDKGSSPEVVVDNFEGTIKATGYAGHEVQLVINETLKADSAERAQAGRREVHLEITRTNNAIQCYVDGPFRDKNGSFNFRGWKSYGYKIRHDFELKVPQQTELRLKTVDGKYIEVEKTSGKFEIENINGRISMTDVSGSGRVYALNDKVHVRFAENPGADSYFGSLNGNVDVWFQLRLSANVRLKTLNGKVFSDFPASYLPPQQPTRKSKGGKFVYKSGEFQGVRIGEGGPELKFDALNGNIRILSQEN
jgi:hypothetical protein